MRAWLKGLWNDEGGGLLEDLGWMVTVGLGALAIGALIYVGIKTFAQNVTTTIESIDMSTVPNPEY